VYEFAHGMDLARIEGISYRERFRADPPQSRTLSDSGLGFAAVRHRRLPPRLPDRKVQRSVPAAILTFPFNTTRAVRRNAPFVSGRRLCRDIPGGVRSSDNVVEEVKRCMKMFPQMKEISSTTTLQLQEVANHRAVRQTQAVGSDLVMHLARDHGLRDAEGDEGVRLPL